MPAKFSGRRVGAGDVHVSMGPAAAASAILCNGPRRVLDDVLDGFGRWNMPALPMAMIVDPIAETVDEAATTAFASKCTG